MRQCQAVALALCCLALPAAAAERMRIVSLAPAATEAVFALGLGDSLVGVSLYCDYPPEVARLDRVGTFLAPSVEGIVAKRPDVVLAMPSPGNQSPVESLRRLGLKVVVVDPHTVAEVYASLLAIARELGREQAGRALVSGIEGRIAAVRGRVGDAPPRKVLMVVGHTPLIAAGEGTVQDELMRMARGINVAAAAGRGWPPLSIEFAIAAAPEVIIDTTEGDEERAGASAATAFWSAFPAIPAVQRGQVRGYKAYQLVRTGPRIGEAFETVARFIHPERFE